MKKRYLLLILVFFITGCWNYRELNTMAIVGSIGIDYDEENNMFDVSVQVFNAKNSSASSNSSSEEKSTVTYYEQKAKTIHEAFRNMVTELPKKLYIGHLDLVIFGEQLAKKHFTDALDFLFRDSESRKDFQVFVTKDCKASDVLKVLTPLITIPSASLRETLASLSKFKGFSTKITYDETLSYVYGTGIEVVLPVVQIVGDVKDGENTDNISDTTTKTRLIVDGMSVFKNNLLIGYLNGDESIGYNFIVGSLEKSVLSFPCDDKNNYASIEINKVKSGSKVKFENEIISNINVDGEAVISEINCQIDLTNQQNILKIQEEANQRIIDLINSALEKSMITYNSDIFGFGNQLYRKQYFKWEEIKNNWYDYFPNIKTSVTSKIKIINNGSISNSTKEG